MFQSRKKEVNDYANYHAARGLSKEYPGMNSDQQEKSGSEQATNNNGLGADQNPSNKKKSSSFTVTENMFASLEITLPPPSNNSGVPVTQIKQQQQQQQEDEEENFYSGIEISSPNSASSSSSSSASSAGSNFSAYAQNYDAEKVMSEILAIEGNEICADCRARNPTWVSCNIGITLCLNCCGFHRAMGVHISKVKSLKLDILTPEEVGQGTNK